MTRVKICGITRLEDALAAEESGADALGFIFYNKSKRYITVQKAAALIARLNPLIAKVGVFVNARAEEINNITQVCGLSHVQLHGAESLETGVNLNRIVIKAFNYSDTLVDDIKPWKKHIILIDSGTNKLPGGTGQTLPWEDLKNLNIKRSYILAGGLNINNIETALYIMNPAAVDVSSGVEIAPGVKDHHLIQTFIAKVKGYSTKNEIL